MIVSYRESTEYKRNRTVKKQDAMHPLSENELFLEG